MRTRSLIAAGLLVALLLAGLVSFYASAAPDGLNRVAEDHGFAATEADSRTAGSPLADYSTSGVENERLSGALAGVTGVVLTFGVGAGLAWLLRGRSTAPRPGER